VATAVASNVLAQASAPFSALQGAEGAVASPSYVEDGWLHERNAQTGQLVATKELVLHPQAEPRPALKHRLIPDEFARLPGNAAVHYLKALGFLEQELPRDKLAQFRKEARSKAEKAGTPSNKFPPHVWLSTAPRDLPLAEVREYLSLTQFQPPIIREAALRDRFDMDRNFRDVDNPIAYLLPEIQNLRELARTQSVRCRLAIAEDRVDDAIAILGQQFALARHLGQDEFLVSNLVGMAISSIAWNDATYLLQHPKAPNLYWALAAMPTPLVDIRHSMSVERQFFFQQLKVLREVDETPRPAGYWQEFIDRFGQMSYLTELNLPSVLRDKELARASMVGLIAAAYPGARDFLIQEEHPHKSYSWQWRGTTKSGRTKYSSGCTCLCGRSDRRQVHKPWPQCTPKGKSTAGIRSPHDYYSPQFMRSGPPRHGVTRALPCSEPSRRSGCTPPRTKASCPRRWMNSQFRPRSNRSPARRLITRYWATARW
jgi:hypothetical protein